MVYFLGEVGYLSGRVRIFLYRSLDYFSDFLCFAGRHIYSRHRDVLLLYLIKADLL